MKPFFVIILIITSFAGEVISGEAFFRPLSREEISIKEGDSFRGVIELWDVENVSPEMVSELIGTTFLDSFYVVALERPKWSENNPEVVVINGMFVLQNKIREFNKVWTHGGLRIPITIKEIQTSVLENKNDKFAIIEKEYIFSETAWGTYVIVFASFLGLTFLVFLIYRKRKVSKNEQVEFINWETRLLKAETRNEFSELYLNKKEWLQLLHGKEELAEDFLSCAELYLFKPEVADFEIQELKDASEKISKGMV